MEPSPGVVEPADLIALLANPDSGQGEADDVAEAMRGARRRGRDVRPRRDRRCDRCPAGSRSSWPGATGRSAASRRQRRARACRSPSIPTGTANDFARALEIPLDPDDAVRLAVEGAETRRARHRPHGRAPVPERREPRACRRLRPSTPRASRTRSARSRTRPALCAPASRRTRCECTVTCDGEELFEGEVVAGDRRLHRRVRRRLVGRRGSRRRPPRRRRDRGRIPRSPGASRLRPAGRRHRGPARRPQPALCLGRDRARWPRRSTSTASSSNPGPAASRSSRARSRWWSDDAPTALGLARRRRGGGRGLVRLRQPPPPSRGGVRLRPRIGHRGRLARLHADRRGADRSSHLRRQRGRPARQRRRDLPGDPRDHRGRGADPQPRDLRLLEGGHHRRAGRRDLRTGAGGGPVQGPARRARLGDHGPRPDPARWRMPESRCAGSARSAPTPCGASRTARIGGCWSPTARWA